MQRRLDVQVRSSDDLARARKAADARKSKPSERIRYVPTVTRDDTLKVPNLKQGIRLQKKEEDVWYTAEDAAEELARPEFMGERPMREDHVALLMLAVMEGTFRQESVEIITAHNQDDGKVYRMNGRHTSKMLVELQGVKGFEGTKLKVRRLHYTVDDFEAMRTLFASIDRGATRTTSHLIITLLAGTAGFENVPHAILRRLAEGFGMWFWKTSHQRRLQGAEHRAYLMKGDFKVVTLNVAHMLMPNKDAGVTANDFRHMLRSPVIAAMIGTFRANASQAEKFWTAVRDGTNLKSKLDPILQLRDLLTTASVAKGIKTSRGTRRLTSEQMLIRCLYAWNWFMNNQQSRLDNLKLSLKERPEIAQRHSS